MENLRVYPYKFGSKSAFEIARGLGTKVLRTKESKWVPNVRTTVINWGSSDENIKGFGPKVKQVINKPSAVDLCANKANFFKAIEGHANIPDWTVRPDIAREWVMNDKALVLGRVNPRGKGGEGIRFSDDDAELMLNTCCMWSKYIPKAREFRVHIFDGKVIDITEKKLRTHDDEGKVIDKEKVNWRVRSHDNGFIFARDNVVAPEDVSTQALNAFGKIKGLTFGAMDVIYNNKQAKAYVLECNTAPGIEGTTSEKYVEAFRRYLVA